MDKVIERKNRTANKMLSTDSSVHINDIDKSERTLIYMMKAIAIYFVVCAHSGVAEDPEITGSILGCFGICGVPVFFMISGYLFDRTERSFVSFWKSKIKTIFIPWVFAYTILYLYVTIRKGGFSIVSWLKFIVGYMSTAYYLTVLVILYLVLWVMKRSQSIVPIVLLMLLSAASIICTGWGVL